MPDRERAESLEEFVRRMPWRGGSSSWCCHAVPRELMAEVEAYVASHPREPRWKAIASWLREQGVEGATADRVKYHFDRGHHDG